MFATPPRQKVRFRTAPTATEATAQSYIIDLHDGSTRVAATVIGEGPTAMLVHGWGGSSADMFPLATALARAGWRSIVFDMPGHGRSPGRESSLVEFLRAMRMVRGALGTPEIIVGHSFGGAAAALAIAELPLPVRAAVLIAPAPGPSYYIDQFVRAVGLPPERTDGMLRHLVRRVGRSIESLDAVTAARSATAPALILHDPGDRQVPFVFAERLRDAWRGSRLLPTPSLGHKRILRDPDVTAAVLDFVRT